MPDCQRLGWTVRLTGRDVWQLPSLGGSDIHPSPHCWKLAGLGSRPWGLHLTYPNSGMEEAPFPLFSGDNLHQSYKI